MTQKVKWIARFSAVALFLFVAVFAASAAGGSDGSLKGMDIVIGNWWGDFDVNTRKANSDAEEKLIEYRRGIMREHGFKMSEKKIASYEQIQQLAAISTMSGKPAAQVFVLEPKWVMTLFNRRLLYPVSNSKAVDFNSSVPVEWNKEIIASFTFNNRAYAFCIGYGTSQHGSGVFFNKRLLQEAGIKPDAPYEMQRNGTWTWNNFMDMCKKLTRDTDNNGIIDTYAMTADLSVEVLDAIVASNGADYIVRDKIGKFANATNRPEFLQALQFAMRLKTEGVLMPRPEISNWDWYKSVFFDGKVAMMVGQQYVAQEFREMKDDWGFVLFPKGPNVTNYRYCTDENVMVIPTTFSAADVDKILYAVQLWYTPIDDDPNAWKDDQYSIYRDSFAVDETLTMLRNPKYGSINYHKYIPGLERGDIAWSMWWWEGDPAQLVESVSQAWNALINDTNNIK